MSKIGMREMLEAGAHFGHSTRRWNPKMAPYIFGPRNGVHIIDLQQTVGLFKDAFEFLKRTTSKGGKVLFVGTKKQAQDVVCETCQKADQYYVNSRWLGGMLTNFKTIKQSVERLKKISKMKEDGTMESLPKKEGIKLAKELEKLEKNLNGIKDMNKIPKAIVIIDPKKEHIAVKEAKVLKIPVVAMIDTNCDPDPIDYPIPANDDSIRSVSLFVDKLAHACVEGSLVHQEDLAHRKAKEDAKAKDEPKENNNKKKGPKVEVVAKKSDDNTAPQAQEETVKTQSSDKNMAETENTSDEKNNKEEATK